MNKGKLIVIEGIDGVGKNTQAKLLHEYISSQGACSLFSFPRYETPSGKLIGEYLNSCDDVNIWDAAKLFSDDRVCASLEMESKIDDGHHIVCDRYTLSNAVYYAAKIIEVAIKSLRNAGKEDHFDINDVSTKIAVKKAIEHICILEHITNELLVPNLTIVLSMDPDRAAAQVFKKEKRIYTTQKQDRNESNKELQMIVNAIYSVMLKDPSYDTGFTKNIRIINCEETIDNVTTIRSVESIHNEIKSILIDHCNTTTKANEVVNV